jgi:hypothetical protein
MLRRTFSVAKSPTPDGEIPGRFRSLWRRLFIPARRHEDIHCLPPYLLRDIGLSEHPARDWERDLR